MTAGAERVSVELILATGVHVSATMTLDEADALSGSLDAGDETFVDLPTVNGPISQGYQSSSHSEHHQRVRCSTVLSITVIKTVLERSS